MLPVVAGRDVLVVGCGDDAVARWLASCGARHVLGIDLSRRVLTLAAPPTLPPVRYCRASAETFALAVDSLDLVVSSLTLHYVVDYDAPIRRVASWLRPHGNVTF